MCRKMKTQYDMWFFPLKLSPNLAAQPDSLVNSITQSQLGFRKIMDGWIHRSVDWITRNQQCVNNAIRLSLEFRLGVSICLLIVNVLNKCYWSYSSLHVSLKSLGVLLCFSTDMFSTVLIHYMHMYLHCFYCSLLIPPSHMQWLVVYLPCLHAIGQTTFQSLPSASMKRIGKSKNLSNLYNLEIPGRTYCLPRVTLECY